MAWQTWTACRRAFLLDGNQKRKHRFPGSTQANWSVCSSSHLHLSILCKLPDVSADRSPDSAFLSSTSSHQSTPPFLLFDSSVRPPSRSISLQQAVTKTSTMPPPTSPPDPKDLTLADFLLQSFEYLHITPKWIQGHQRLREHPTEWFRDGRPIDDRDMALINAEPMPWVDIGEQSFLKHMVGQYFPTCINILRPVRH